MPKIVVINNATEQMLGQRLTARQANFAAKAALRNIWLARAGDIVVSTAPLSDEFKAYISHITSYANEAGTPDFLRANTDDEANVVLQDKYLLRTEFIERLRLHITEAKEWSLLACYQTAGTARLQSELGLASTGGAEIGRKFAEHMGTNLLNRKSHFRQLAIGCGLPLAEGTLVTCAPDLRQAVAELISSTGKVIVKQDNGAGGTGNCVLSDTATGPLPGAYASMEIPRDCQNSDREFVRLWEMWQQASPGPMVVEAYHSATAMFYLEFLITPDGSVQFINTGAIRLRAHDDPEMSELFWVGLELPAELPSATLAEAVVGCSRLLQLAALMGYRGHVNIDAITTDTGQLIFNEVNARWGGGTVLHDLAARLLGPDFTKTHIAASFRDVPSPGFTKLTALLQENDIAYDPVRQHGIVILACDDQHSKTFEALILARSRPEARALERRLVEVLNVKEKQRDGFSFN